MGEYYAVIRTDDELAHYGVKGMKWGVRKAIERGNTRKLSRIYRKAERKLAQLNRKANIRLQEESAKKHNKRAKIALGAGAAGIGAFVGNRAVARHLANKFLSSTTTKMAEGATQAPPITYFNSSSARKKRMLGEGKGIYKVGEGLGIGPVGDGTNGIAGSAGRKEINPFRVVHNVSAGVGAAGLTAAAYQKGRAIAAKRRTTAKGHAKAVKRRDNFQKEMDKAFKGTPYDRTKKKKTRRVQA